MKNTKTLLSILLIVALLCGCTPVAQPSTSQNLEQPTSTATQPQPTTTVPATQPTTVPATQPTTQPTPTTQPAPTEPEAKLAPDFTVYDAEGNEVKLSDYLGQKVIVNFWASWCFPCLAELPHFNKKFQEYGDQIQFLMVHMTAFDEKAAGQNVVDSRGYTFPVFFDPNASAAKAYQVSAIPATYVIDEEGYIMQEVIGSMTEKELQSLIDMLLGGE